MRAPRLIAALAAALGTALALVAHAADTPLGLEDQKLRPEDIPAVESRMLASVAGPVDGATYIVGPGDVLDMHFTGALSQSITMTVSPEGTAFVRGFGTIKIGGMTLDQARRELRRAIAGDTRRGMQIEIELIRVRLIHVFFSGDVTSQGPKELPATARAAQALADIVKPDGSHRNIELRHRDGTRDVVDLERFARLGDVAANPLLRDDDLFYVPPATAFIEASGAVNRPARLELGARDSLRSLVELCGGLMPAARLEQSLFVRWTGPAARESTWIDMNDVVAGRFNPRLRDGDRLFVSAIGDWHRLETATITGEVQHPGVYMLRIGQTRLSDLVKLAGGFGTRADLSAIRIYRPRGAGQDTDLELERLSRLSRNDMTNSEYEVLRTRLAQRRVDFRVDWNRLARAPQEDLFLEAGDIVRVEAVVTAVRVEGSVVRPGLVRYEPGSSIERYVRSAGGYSARAHASKILVTRAVTGQTLPAREVTQIEPGDMIWVPERPDRSFWQNAATLIALSAQVATLVIAIRQ